MTDSEQELADAIEQLTQHIQVLYETIEDLKTEVQWLNNNRFAPAPNGSESIAKPNCKVDSNSTPEKVQGGLF